MSSLQHCQIETNGVRLHAVVAGPEGGPVVIFLHGFPEFWYSWRRQIEHFARAGYRVIVPDQRGYNLSDKPSDIADYSIKQLAGDVAGVIDTVKWQQVSVVGHDWGGAVAFWLARHRPERVGRLVVINAPHFAVLPAEFRRNFKQLWRSRYMFFMQAPWLPETMYKQANYARLVKALRRTSRPGTFSDDDIQQYRQAWAQPDALRSMVNWYRALLRHRPKLPDDVDVRVATLLLWGEQDRFLGKELAEASIAHCPHGRLVTFDDATHWLHLEEPQRVNALIEEFLAGA
ncbi:MAG: alpha/beta hydrolase [Pirellulaceae bacterium]